MDLLLPRPLSAVQYPSGLRETRLKSCGRLLVLLGDPFLQFLESPVPFGIASLLQVH